MIYTKGQQDAIDDVVSWVRKPYDGNKGDFIIRGVAGTGKSTVIQAIIKELNIRVAVCGPTHRSIRVLKNMGVEKTHTIHSMLGLRLNTNIENFDIRNPNFDPQTSPKFPDYSVVVFDEASMIPKAVKSFITNMGAKYKTKIIFIGDPLQLPPVKEHLSEALKVRNYNFVELKDIVRQEKGHPLLELLGIVREDIVNGTSEYIKYLKQNPDRMEGNSGYKIYTREAYAQKVLDLFGSTKYETDVNYVKYLAFTNNQISNVNKYIREHIIPNGKFSIITKDDLFTGYQTIVEPQLLTPILVNSDDYVPKDIRPFTNVSGYDGFIVHLSSIYDSHPDSSIFILDHTKPSMVDYIARLSDIMFKAKQNHRVWTDYYSFKNSHASMIKFKLYNASHPTGISVDRDLDYAYGSTVHKSQGSTYENAFIDLKDINTAFLSGVTFRNRLVYVALSRVQNQAFLRF